MFHLNILRSFVFKAKLLPCLIAVFGVASAIANAAEVDHSLYDSLLKQHVTDNGLVRYEDLQQDKEQLDKYLRQLRNASLEDASKATKLAFYINAYNACTLQLILRHYPDIESIRDIGGMFGSPFKDPEWELAGEKLALEEIEKDLVIK